MSHSVTEQFIQSPLTVQELRGAFQSMFTGQEGFALISACINAIQTIQNHLREDIKENERSFLKASLESTVSSIAKIVVALPQEMKPFALEGISKSGINLEIKELFPQSEGTHLN